MMKDNEDPSTLKFWWHSHANMSVFWSGTDDVCAETLSKEFAFSMVVNKAGERKCRLDLYSPFRIIFDGVKIQELTQDDTKLKEECEKEVKEKVKAPYENYHYVHGNEYRYEGYDRYYNARRGESNYQRLNGHSTFNHVRGRVTIPDQLVSDIEDLIAEASMNANEGGVFCANTWTNFRLKILKDVLEKRFEKKAGCTQFGSYDPDFISCTDKKKCGVIEKCRFWTKFTQECEEDTKKLADLTDLTSVNTEADIKIT